MEFNQYEVDALMYITNRPPIVFLEGEGMFLTDHNGKRSSITCKAGQSTVLATRRNASPMR